MNVIVQIYMIVCIVLLAFDIFFLVIKNARNQRFYPRVPKFEERIKEEIKNKQENGDFSPEFKEDLPKKLKKTKYLLALMSILEENGFARSWFKQTIFDLFDCYKAKSDYEQAYYSYSVSRLGYEEEKVPKEFAYKFLELLDSKSLYTFSNAMMAIYEFGNIDVLFSAVGKVNERNGFYHKKLFVDGLLGARSDKKELADKLMARFESYNDFTKECILEYLRMSGDDAADFCMKVVKGNPANEEIKYAAERYFIKYPNEKSREFFLSVLAAAEPINWIDEMIAMQGLASFTDEKVHTAISKRITGANWYVRVNAAEYIKKNLKNKEELEEIINRKDKYANEVLLYQYRDDSEMAAYVSSLISKAGEEESK